MPQEIIGPLLSIGAALELPVIGYVLLALVLAGVVSFATTPLVKALSVKVGAIDVPRDGRRMHDHPIPRMGGLAIFLGFIISVLLLMPLDQPKQGMLLGAVIIVVLGIFDDIYALSAKLKFVVQIAAACVAVFSGNRIEVLSNPNIFSSNPYWELGVLSVPVTIIWIVALTNAVNLIDGLDGLACGGHRPAGQRGGCGRHDGSAGRGLYRLFALQPESSQDFHGRYRSNLPRLYLGHRIGKRHV